MAVGLHHEAMLDSRIVLTVLAAIATVALVRLIRRAKTSVDRSPQEVASIPTQFISGEESGFLADEFITVPITDLALDRIREEFDKLTRNHPAWEPQAPFPAEGLSQLRHLIERAEALALHRGSKSASD